jgi:hypothetical protein
MLRQHSAEQPSSGSVGPITETVVDAHPVNRRTTARRITIAVIERTLGECWSSTPKLGVLVLAMIVGLLGVIALTLSIGNALLVALVAVVMRVACERRSPVA